MDIKNSLIKYSETVGIPDFDTRSVEDSVHYLLSNPLDYEFRTTVVKEFHKADDMINIAKWIEGTKRYYLQSFVDSGDLIENGLSGYGKEEMEALVKLILPYIPTVKLRGV